MTAWRSGVPALLALADQRLPAGGHAHSGGVEQAVTDGLVHDCPSLTRFLRRRLRTAGRVAAGLAAAAVVASADGIRRLDAEADARTPSPAQREASRSQGRGLLRVARSAWADPDDGFDWEHLGARPHHPVALGCSARAAGLDTQAAALVAAYLSVTAPATAAQRLLGLDPVAVAAATLSLGAAIEETATVADRATGACADLPDDSDPLLDLLAERHASRKDRLFAS